MLKVIKNLASSVVFKILSSRLFMVSAFIAIASEWMGFPLWKVS